MSATDAERLARLGLARVAEPGTIAVWQALQTRPAEEVWAAVRDGAPLDQLGQQALAGMQHRVSGTDPERDLEALHALGARVVCPSDDEWPDGLEWLPSAMGGDVKQMAPPWVLLARGKHPLRSALGASCAVVGARAASAYGVHVTKEIAFALAEAGVTVVSGGAYGIDAAAHRAALSAQAAPTVAVLAGGHDVVYPRGNDRLLAQIADEGLVVTEVPPGSSVTRMRFLVRNRVVAAMTQGTLVVEAAQRSGSLSTAGRAGDLGRKLMAVPGPVTSVASTGCHELIKAHRAELVTGAVDVLEILGQSGEHLRALVRGPEHPRDGLREQARRVLDAVPVRAPAAVPRIARTAGVSALVVQMVLPELLVAGLVEQREGGWRLTALGASGP